MKSIGMHLSGGRNLHVLTRTDPELLQPAHPHSSPVFCVLCSTATHMSNGVTRGIFDPSSPLNCYRTSLHPQCAGSKPRTCPSSNTSLGTSFLLVHSQHSLAWLSYTLTAKYETKDDSTCHVHRIFCASKGQNEIYYQFE